MDTPEKSIYSKFPFLKSTPTKHENLMEFEHSGLLQSSSLGFNTFKNEYLEYDDPMASVSPSKSARNSDIEEFEERIDQLQERVDLNELEIQDLQKQLADALAALQVRNQMLDDSDSTIANLTEEVKDYRVEIEELKFSLGEKGEEITRLDCNFRMERSQFHSDMEHLHEENANLIKDLSARNPDSDLVCRYQEVLESNKELTEMLEELSKPKIAVACQYDIEELAMDIGCQTAADLVTVEIQASVDLVPTASQTDMSKELVSTITQTDSEIVPSPVLVPTLVDNLPFLKTTPKISAATQSDYVEEKESFLKSKSFLGMEEISEVWQDGEPLNPNEIVELRTQLEEILKSTMATRGYLIDRGHFDKEIERWIDIVKKEVGENEFLVRRVQEGLDKEVERSTVLREKIAKLGVGSISRTVENVTVLEKELNEVIGEMKEFSEAATQTLNSSTAAELQASDSGQNYIPNYQIPADQQVYIQQSQETQKSSRPFSMLFSIGVVLMAYVSWQTANTFYPRKNITLI